jgi:hypothetical protein
MGCVVVGPNLSAALPVLLSIFTSLCILILYPTHPYANSLSLSLLLSLSHTHKTHTLWCHVRVQGAGRRWLYHATDDETGLMPPV